MTSWVKRCCPHGGRSPRPPWGLACVSSDQTDSSRKGSKALSCDPPFMIGIDRHRYVDRYIDERQYVRMRLIQTIDAECCPQLLAEPLGETGADKLAAALRVLADPARLRLLSLIGAHPNGEACVCDLTASLGLSQPTVSHHLKILADAGLVGREQRGRWVYFWVLPEPLELLRGALAAPVGGAMSRVTAAQD